MNTLLALDPAAPAAPLPAEAPLPRADSLSGVAVVLQALCRRFAETAAERDVLGGTPKAQRDDIRRSGLLRLSIPQSLGGLGGRWSLVLSAVRQLARADSSLAHLFAFHHLMLATVQLFGQPAQWQPWLRHTAQRDWFWGNALNPLDRRTTWRRTPHGLEFSGMKSFCSGALDSQMLVVSAVDESDASRMLVAAVPTSRSGIHLMQDWDNIGQRQTDSGSVYFDRLRVEDDELLLDPGPLSTPLACMRPLLAQAILANIYVGIAEGAFSDALHYTLHEARPWPGSRRAAAEEDPHVLTGFGEFHVGLEAMRLLTDRAGQRVDEALQRGSELTADERGATAVAIAAAKVCATRTGLDICNRLFEVTGARSTHARLGLDRHWRNLRTHTLHDPVQLKLQELGDWVLKGQWPQPTFYS